jgi:hypothetical protein
MHIAFSMEEYDEPTNVKTKAVVIEFELPADATHDKITEVYGDFLRAVGYVLNGNIEYVSNAS